MNRNAKYLCIVGIVLMAFNFSIASFLQFHLDKFSEDADSIIIHYISDDLGGSQRIPLSLVLLALSNVGKEQTGTYREQKLSIETRLEIAHQLSTFQIPSSQLAQLTSKQFFLFTQRYKHLIKLNQSNLLFYLVFALCITSFATRIVMSTRGKNNSKHMSQLSQFLIREQNNEK
ncbi:hypothetical protein [Vibrio alginolyticus]|uniref:hypothetical protein n=1 Tax=Vibrio alginolyticus TaxID=663 RepID=UPI0015934C40|nr:hypothetical protein [Vibrio alginolyticus]QKS98456.1 hypothetical protein HUO05_24960 [Vibrio alginolyticus]